MKLHLEARMAVVALIEQAHAECVTDDGFPPAQVAGRFVDLVSELQAFGQPWIDDYVRDLAIVGAKRVCADWRRSHQLDAKTPRGSRTSLPAYAGIAKPKTSDDGVRHLQLPLRDLGLEELKQHAARMAKQRNTVSTQLQVINALVKHMEADPSCATAGAAIDALGLAA